MRKRELIKRIKRQARFLLLMCWFSLLVITVVEVPREIDGSGELFIFLVRCADPPPRGCTPAGPQLRHAVTEKVLVSPFALRCCVTLAAAAAIAVTVAIAVTAAATTAPVAAAAAAATVAAAITGSADAFGFVAPVAALAFAHILALFACVSTPAAARWWCCSRSTLPPLPRFVASLNAAPAAEL